jgi:hypothetical protein
LFAKSGYDRYVKLSIKHMFVMAIKELPPAMMGKARLLGK